MMESVELKLDRSLINSNFEGYKLSLDSLPVYKVELEDGIYSTELTDEQYSFHHLKIFGVHNQLTLDQWNRDHVYYVDKNWNVIEAASDEGSIHSNGTVFTIPDSADRQLVPNRYNVVIKFTRPDLAVLGDGTGRLFILDTNNRENHSKWKVLLSKTVPEEDKPCLLVDAIELSNGENHKLECLLVNVVESTPEEKDKYRSLFLTVLHWVTFVSVDRKSWTLQRTRRLVSRKPYSYAALGRDGKSLIIAGEDEFHFIFDSTIPVKPTDKNASNSKVSRPPDYTWLQTNEDITVQFTVPDDVTKAQIYLTLTSDHVDFGIKNSVDLLKGPLHGAVDVGASTWTIEGQRVDLVLSKVDENKWPLVVQGDTRGEMVITPEEAEAIHKQLAEFTSEELNPDPEKQEKPYNTQELEECDMYTEDNFVLMRLDGETHKTTHMSNLGSNQWLFNAELDNTKAPVLCLRHDVDGLLWQPESSSKQNEPPWKHTATFNAFGYVQASKQTRKFTTCPPDCSYAVISDTFKHLYMYRQAVSVSTPLRNRKTGQQVNSIAKQQVIALEAVDNIIGLQATNEKIFVLTESVLHMIKV